MIEQETSLTPGTLGLVETGAEIGTERAVTDLTGPGIDLIGPGIDVIGPGIDLIGPERYLTSPGIHLACQQTPSR